jgi:hypothetical protein
VPERYFIMVCCAAAGKPAINRNRMAMAKRRIDKQEGKKDAVM